MAEIPRSLVADAQIAFHLLGRDAFLRVAHQGYGQHPFTQRQMRIAEDCACRCSKLVFAFRIEALIHEAVWRWLYCAVRIFACSALNCELGNPVVIAF